jgi:SAM-dependent methyltransferase
VHLLSARPAEDSRLPAGKPSIVTMIRGRQLSGTPRPQARMLREIQTYNDDRTAENNYRWRERVPHVMAGPNTRFGDRRFLDLLRDRATGSRVMDVGCGTGELSAELHAMGASEVYGFDASQRQIEQARAKYGEPEGLTFGTHGAEAPIEGCFDLIVGNSVLHHVDFRTVMVTLFEKNLVPGGRMVFMEPMSHPFTLAFHRLVPSAHTPDEWPITPTDVAWMRDRFGARVVPVNLFSFPAGIVSSYVLPSEDNSLMRFADRIDRRLERRGRLVARGRQGIIVIDRPSDPLPTTAPRPGS